MTETTTIYGHTVTRTTNIIGTDPRYECEACGLSSNVVADYERWDCPPERHGTPVRTYGGWEAH